MKLSSAQLNANRPKLSRIPLFCVLSFTGTAVREATEQSDFRRLSDLGFGVFFNHIYECLLFYSQAILNILPTSTQPQKPKSVFSTCLLKLERMQLKREIKTLQLCCYTRYSAATS